MSQEEYEAARDEYGTEAAKDAMRLPEDLVNLCDDAFKTMGETIKANEAARRESWTKFQMFALEDLSSESPSLPEFAGLTDTPPPGWGARDTIHLVTVKLPAHCPLIAKYSQTGGVWTRDEYPGRAVDHNEHDFVSEAIPARARWRVGDKIYHCVGVAILAAGAAGCE